VTCTSANDTAVRGTRSRLGAKHSDSGSALEILSSAAFGAARESSTPKHVVALVRSRHPRQLSRYAAFPLLVS